MEATKLKLMSGDLTIKTNLPQVIKQILLNVFLTTFHRCCLSFIVAVDLLSSTCLFPCTALLPCTGDIITLASINSQGKPPCFVSVDWIATLEHFLRLSMLLCCSQHFQLTQANSLADCSCSVKHNNDSNSLGSYQLSASS